MTHLLKRTGLTAQQTEFAALLDESSNTLLAIVDDLLDFSRVEAGHFQLVNKRFDIVPLLEKTTDLLALSAQAKGLSLLFTYDDLPRAYFGDPTRIRQLVTNIVGNAIKFTNRGSVHVHLEGKIEDHHCAFALHIEDTGPGIPSDFVDQVFLPFTQADNSSSRKQSGAGLGLAFAREICDQMKGTLEFTSSPKGTNFLAQFSLPVENTPQTNWKHELEGERVVVDIQEAGLRKWLVRLLEREGLLPVEDLEKDALAVIRVHDEPTKLKKTDSHVLRYVNLKTPVCADDEVTTLFHPIRLRPLLAVLMRLQALRRGDSHTPLFGQPSILPAGSNGKRVLVVEEGAVNQRLATLLVEQCGYVAEIACHGGEALQVIESKPNHFDAILMDC
ncbi:MAG: hypothetical protein GY822_21980 [Deltaproteobacteria bacterium]|nr:hypothetical protein [Deltaproteobacteria bacterium]